MEIPHFRAVYFTPPGEIGVNLKMFVTWPGEEEKELPSCRGYSVSHDIKDAQEIGLRFLATMEVQYAN